MRGLSCRAFIPLQKFPSFLSLAAGGGSFAKDRVPRPLKLKACPREEAGRQEESPAVISLAVSRYQRNIQVWEKTYPGCTGVESGDSSRGPRIRTSSRLLGKGEVARAAAAKAPGSPSLIACGSRRTGFLFKFRFGASFTPNWRTNPLPRPNRKGCLSPWTNQQPSRFRGTILRGSRGVGPEG